MTQAISAVFKKNNTRLTVTAVAGGIAFKLSADRVLELEFTPADMAGAKAGFDGAVEALKAAIKAVEASVDAPLSRQQDAKRRLAAAEQAHSAAGAQLKAAELLATLAFSALPPLPPQSKVEKAPKDEPKAPAKASKHVPEA